MLSIHALTESDHDEWLGLWRGYLTFYEADLSDDVTARTFGRLVDGVDLHGAIARDDEGRAVGIVHWLTHPATWATTTYCYLEDLFVDPAARGVGAGGALIAHVAGWARENSCEKVYWLTAETNTTARALYDRVAQKSGFVHYELEL
ncbi:GNAT family N-acetyltransferase [Microbacterium fluvii]|uniref:GNAT family N-acetyltransferase n=1 Tax=Microbacterium fluvii TaxID=415215 RepID=A0ABW2HB81_9MICO|nr:GNAT family N-acetyltransferase [Microbacterium fluvii]MCU4672162.1 GNAT family N-acetyltransferase [Microbacterium fluvii]